MTDTNFDYPKNNIGRELLPLTIINQTKRENLYFYLVGTSDTDTPQHHWYYLSNVNGDVTLCTPTNGTTDYSLPLTGTETTIQMPRLAGIRVYFSFDKKLELTAGDDGIPGSPSGWGENPNFRTLFDWIELNWVVNATDMTLGGNTTQVDMLGLPFGVSLTGFDADKNPQTLTTGFVRGGERKQIMEALKQAPSPWNKLIISDEATGEDYRVISPYHGMELNLFPRNQLDDYIDRVWEKYTTEKLTVSAEDVEFTGQVKDGNLVFTDDAGDTVTFPKPTGFITYTSGPVFTPDTKVASKAGVIQTILQAGFLRSTLLLTSTIPDCTVADFYREEPVNHYGKIIHQFAPDGGAYAFGYDDVCARKSQITVHNPRSAAITIFEF
jgi:hypothetical protein